MEKTPMFAAGPRWGEAAAVAVLLGFESLDYWNQTYNRRAVENELKKLDPEAKRKLAEELLAEVDQPASSAAPTA